ncbi:uncharacterized protein LOC131950562 [Physella acuta]|uniref:uncharacterized protein LOC131950562 n=1 Tax=Physella acuta TaxID=109671 RepID=UPI0027DCEE7C|nr:uncharacterized protein LOC131950562 [Physella acuta]
MMLELLTTSDRKLAAAITGVVWSVCVMTLALVAFLLRDNSWRTLQIVLSSTSLFVVLQILYLDESLRWMVANGKIKQAVKVIKKAVKMNKCDEDVVLKIFQDHVEQVQSQNVLENFDIKSLVNMEKRESLYQQNFDTQKVLCEQSNGQINMILFGADHQNTNCLKKNDHQETLSQPDEHQETLSQPADHQEALSQPADPQETLSQPADPQETLSQPADHQATLSQPANHQETLTQIADHQETLSQLADHQETVSQPADHQETVSQPADHQETLSQLADHQETLSQLADHQETLSQTADHQETLSQTADHQETLSKTADHQGTVPQKADHQETLSQPADHQETLSQTADHQETLSKTADHQGTVPQTADYQETLSQPADHQETLTQTTDHQNTLCQQSVDYHYYQEYVKQQKDIGDTKPHLELSEFSQCKAVNSEQNLVSSGEDKLSQNSQIIHSEQMSFFDLVKDRRLLVTSLVNGLLWFTTAVGYFGIYFTSTTLVGNRFLNFFLTALMEAPSNLMLYSILDRFGRRISTGGVFAILGISVLASGICRHLQQVYNDDIFAYLALGFSLLGMLGASSCFGIVFLYTPEMFPTNIRNQALGVSSFVGRLGGMLAPFLGLLAEQAIWLSGLLIASLCTLVCLTLRFLPETNGRELPQSLQELKRW